MQNIYNLQTKILKQTNTNLCFNIQPKPAGGYVENHLSDKQTKCKCETQGAQQNNNKDMKTKTKKYERMGKGKNYETVQ